MRLDASLIRYLTSIEWRVLTAVEMGMKNHELVPVPLITRIANTRRAGITQVLSTLLKHKLIAHEGQSYDGYKLTYLGYDFLALRAFVSRGHLVGVCMRMGVGKESDIHVCQGPDGKVLILKLHRLGRVSFRTIKKNRDYLGHRQHASWMYMARLAAAKEFAYMKALHEQGFPVPEPVDVNRHAIVMEYIDAYPLSQVRELRHPQHVLETLMRLIVRLAEAGLVHGDFNEFNLMIDDEERITLIDFPQIISASHPNAEEYFTRDVQCIRTLFSSKFGIDVVEYPKYHDIAIPELSLQKEPLDLEDEQALLEIYCNEKQDDDSHIDDDGSPSLDNDNDASSQAEPHSETVESASESGTFDHQEDATPDDAPRPQRLDHVWTPSVKRATTKGANEKYAAAKARAARKKASKGNMGAKKNREARRLEHELF